MIGRDGDVQGIDIVEEKGIREQEVSVPGSGEGNVELVQEAGHPSKHPVEERTAGAENGSNLASEQKAEPEVAGAASEKTPLSAETRESAQDEKREAEALQGSWIRWPSLWLPGQGTGEMAVVNSNTLKESVNGRRQLAASSTSWLWSSQMDKKKQESEGTGAEASRTEAESSEESCREKDCNLGMKEDKDKHLGAGRDGGDNTDGWGVASAQALGTMVVEKGQAGGEPEGDALSRACREIVSPRVDECATTLRGDGADLWGAGGTQVPNRERLMSQGEENGPPCNEGNNTTADYATLQSDVDDMEEVLCAPPLYEFRLGSRSVNNRAGRLLGSRCPGHALPAFSSPSQGTMSNSNLDLNSSLDVNSAFQAHGVVAELKKGETVFSAVDGAPVEVQGDKERQEEGGAAWLMQAPTRSLLVGTLVGAATGLMIGGPVGFIAGTGLKLASGAAALAGAGIGGSVYPFFVQEAAIATEKAEPTSITKEEPKMGSPSLQEGNHFEGISHALVNGEGTGTQDIVMEPDSPEIPVSHGPQPTDVHIARFT